MPPSASVVAMVPTSCGLRSWLSSTTRETAVSKKEGALLGSVPVLYLFVLCETGDDQALVPSTFVARIRTWY